MSQYLTNITGDVFGLNYVYDRQVENIENRNSFQWREDPIYGYTLGGVNPAASAICNVTRLDFSNETVSLPVKDLVATRNANSPVISSSY